MIDPKYWHKLGDNFRNEKFKQYVEDARNKQEASLLLSSEDLYAIKIDDLTKAVEDALTPLLGDIKIVADYVDDLFIDWVSKNSHTKPFSAETKMGKVYIVTPDALEEQVDLTAIQEYDEPFEDTTNTATWRTGVPSPTSWHLGAEREDHLKTGLKGPSLDDFGPSLGLD